MPSSHAEFRQVHVDVARNSTDDFNPFHDPLRWRRINGNPFGAPIVLGFQLEFLLSDRIQRRRISEGCGDNTLRYRNFEFGFVNALRVDEAFSIDVRKTVDKVAQGGGLSNRAVLRKSDGKPFLVGSQSETPAPRFDVNLGVDDLPSLSVLPDRAEIPGTDLFLKRKYLTTSNAKNFSLAALCRQQDYIDELDEKVFFAPLFTASLLSCALLERGTAHRQNFEAEPMVYTSHQISVDMDVQARLRSNDRLHLLVSSPETLMPKKGLGKAGVEQQQFCCLGVVGDDSLLFQAMVHLAPLRAFAASA